MSEGWICPRCGRVNAPWVEYCGCNKIDAASTQDPCLRGVHDWQIVEYRPSKSTASICTVEYKCRRCGGRKFADTPTGINTLWGGTEKGIKDMGT